MMVISLEGEVSYEGGSVAIYGLNVAVLEKNKRPARKVRMRC